MVFPVVGAIGAAVGVAGLLSGLSAAKTQAKIQTAQIQAQVAMSSMNYKMRRSFAEAAKVERQKEFEIKKYLLESKKKLAKTEEEFQFKILDFSHLFADIQSTYKAVNDHEAIAGNALAYSERGLTLSVSMNVYRKNLRKMEYARSMQKVERDIKFYDAKINIMLGQRNTEIGHDINSFELSNNIAKQELNDIENLAGMGEAQNAANIQGIGKQAATDANKRGQQLNALFSGVKQGINTYYDYKTGSGLFNKEL